MIESHKEIIASIKIVKAAHDFHSRTTALKQAMSGKSNVDERVRKEILKEGRTPILNTVFDKSEEGYAEFNQFINKDYYEKYLPREETVFELCQLKEKETRPRNLFSKATNLVGLTEIMQAQQKAICQLIIKEKTLQVQTKVVNWLIKNTKIFRQMPLKMA